MADMKKKLTQEDLEKVVGGAKLELKTRPLDDPEPGSLGGWVDVYVDGVLRETVRYHDEKEIDGLRDAWLLALSGGKR